MPGNRMCAEIRRGPLGKAPPSRMECERFMEVWRGAGVLLTTLREEDPPGEPELPLAPDTGVEVHCRSGREGNR